jgi:hypothetical protein
VVTAVFEGREAAKSIARQLGVAVAEATEFAVTG